MEDLGRAIGFTWNGSVIPGVRSKGVNRNGAAVDVTSDENSGKRQLLTKPAQDNVDLSLSGITKVRTLQQAWHSGNRTGEVVITHPDGSTETGMFYLQDYNETAPYNDAITFEATILSTGAVAYTPGV